MKLVRRLAHWLRLSSHADELAEEVTQHRAMVEQDLIERGMSPADARVEARRIMGNDTYMREEARAVWLSPKLDALAGDLRFAFRYFGRNKLTVGIVVAVFALGIGANTGFVTLLQSHMLRPAPAVPDDDALVRIWEMSRATRTSRWDIGGISYPELRAIAANTGTFTSAAGWLESEVVLNPGDSIGARGVRMHYVTPTFFTTLGVHLAAGAGFTARDDEGPDLSAVISFGMAEQLYGAPEVAVGQRVLVNDVAVRIVGLAPPAFQGPLKEIGSAGSTALWIPVSARADIARINPRWSENATLQAFARVAPDVTHDDATTVARQVVARALPDSAERVGMARTAQVLALSSLLASDPETAELLLLYAAFGTLGVLLLLVTCTNVSSLMVAAAVTRRQEIAVRLSLGASRARVMRQLLTESVLLALAGGAGGLLLLWWGLRIVAGPLGAVEGLSLMPDLQTLAFTMAIAIGTGLVFGLAPALHATRGSLSIALHDSGAGVSRKSRLQRGFVVAQIVFSIPLLMVLGVTFAFTIEDFEFLRGDVRQRVVAATFRPLSQTGGPGQRREAVDSLMRHLAAHPAVVSVVPDVSTIDVRPVVRAPFDSGEAVQTRVSVEGAMPGWFAVLGVPILLGRDVALADTSEGAWPVVIGSDLARTLWGNAHPIGRTLASIERDTVSMVVVGVYDAAGSSTREYAEPPVYTAHGKVRRRDKLLIRTRGTAEPLLPELHRLIRDRAPGLPVSWIRTLAQEDAAARRDSVEGALLVGAFCALAMLLVSLGIYGVIALAVRQRTREIGIRIALGAKPARVSTMFLVSGVRLGGVALLIGLPLCAAIFAMLFMKRLGPVTIWGVSGSIAVVLLAVTAAATWIPARRAAHVDPARTLRVD